MFSFVLDLAKVGTPNMSVLGQMFLDARNQCKTLLGALLASAHNGQAR
jgi:hypothetical protein